MTPPYKCPDCGVWWSGPEHRCRWEPITTTVSSPNTTVYVTCNCRYNPNGTRVPQTAPCPVHDVAMTYTT